MEENTNKPNNPNQSNKKPGKKPYYKKRYNPQPQKRKFWNADKIVGLSAMSIALFTLVVLIYQSRILERQYELTVKQQKASVMPNLQFGPSYSSDYYKIVVQNKGLGPAFIKGLYVREKDSTFVLFNLDEYYDKKTSNKTDSLINIGYSSFFEGVVLAPGDKVDLIFSEGNPRGIEPIQKFFAKYFTGSGSNYFIIEYQSVFDDAWVVESTFQHFTKEEYGEFEFFNDLVE